MPSRTSFARRSSTHRSSVAPDEDLSMRTNGASEAASVLDDPKYTLASSFLATMMREVIIDTAMLAHRTVTRQRRAQGILPGGCPVCRTTCQGPPPEAVHADGEKKSTIKVEGEESNGGEAAAAEGSGSAGNSNGNGHSAQPRGLEIYHNNPLLACLVCSRQVSANRYAQHLASCVGVGKGGLARRKGKNAGSSKVKTALENRKRAGFMLSGASTPLQKTIDDTASAASDDEGGKRNRTLAPSSLGLNANGKRSASPADGHDAKKQRTSTPPMSSDGPSRAQSLLGVSALAASQPTTGSPLNPHRNSKVIPLESDEGDDDDDDDEEEEGAVSISRTQNAHGRSSSVLSGGGDDGSEFAEEESNSEGNNDSDDQSYVQSKSKQQRRDSAASVQSDLDDDF